MSRPQFPVIDILRDKASEVYGKAVCGKKVRGVDEKRNFDYIEYRGNLLSFSGA